MTDSADKEFSIAKGNQALKLRQLNRTDSQLDIQYSNGDVDNSFRLSLNYYNEPSELLESADGQFANHSDHSAF